MIFTSQIFSFLFIISSFLFAFGLIGVFYYRHNLLVVLMSIELMLLSINFNLVLFSMYLDDFGGQILSLVLLTIAAAESAIGLTIFSAYYQQKQDTNILKDINTRR